MRLYILILTALAAFAGNSLLNRYALSSGAIGPIGFAAIRVLSGAGMLLLVFLAKHRRLPKRDIGVMGPVGLLIYMVAFSLAYVALNAGFGALLLFGSVQISMFIGAILRGQRPHVFEYLGAMVAFVGLVYLLYPDLQVGGGRAIVVMIAAGIGWALFSIAGQGAREPLQATTLSFAMILPVVLGIWLVAPSETLSARGALLAALSGAGTSGLGYLVWYTVLPKISTTRAAIFQLSVPIIAIVAGALLLFEPIEARVLIASTVVIGGIIFSLYGRKHS
ncbi:hypothetical protein GCM10007939_23420 [Amylibacter marinus]|uniref:EamA domain-containing protein n=1 Tax=Amylibacter marinus TaxID=1475483 RepID=A0ABQ5VY87_9RHOB|nr:DMT family transporter [Amylibacter marinus]GLQ36058.1 hypothetical protein GCM10007939_23420 [Amylibacter marinus]